MKTYGTMMQCNSKILQSSNCQPVILPSFSITTDQLLDQWPLYVGCLTVEQTSPQLVNILQQLLIDLLPPALPRLCNPGDQSLEN